MFKLKEIDKNSDSLNKEITIWKKRLISEYKISEPVLSKVFEGSGATETQEVFFKTLYERTKSISKTVSTKNDHYIEQVKRNNRLAVSPPETNTLEAAMQQSNVNLVEYILNNML